MTLRVFHLFFTQDYCWRILINFTAYSGLWLKISLGKAYKLFLSGIASRSKCCNALSRSDAPYLPYIIMILSRTISPPHPTTLTLMAIFIINVLSVKDRLTLLNFRTPRMITNSWRNSPKPSTPMSAVKLT